MKGGFLTETGRAVLGRKQMANLISVRSCFEEREGGREGGIDVCWCIVCLSAP